MSHSIRPSLRKLQEAERAAEGSAWDAQQAAIAEMVHSLEAAIDRIRVAGGVTEFGGTTVAQLRHARSHIQLGPDRGAGRLHSFDVPDDDADDLVRLLAEMWHEAYVAELLERAYRRAQADHEGRQEPVE